MLRNLQPQAPLNPIDGMLVVGRNSCNQATLQFNTPHVFHYTLDCAKKGIKQPAWDFPQ